MNPILLLLGVSNLTDAIVQFQRRHCPTCAAQLSNHVRRIHPSQKTRLKNIQIINNSLFSEFDDWSRAGWKKFNKSIENTTTPAVSRQYVRIDESKLATLKNEEYRSLLGIDKETFEKIFQMLNDAFINLHAPGGRPARLSVFDRLMITIEYTHNNSTMDNIATDYGVSKSRISDAIKWVKKTLADSEMPLDQILISEHDKLSKMK